jgi:hypothetical protein
MNLDFLDRYADQIAASRAFLTRMWNRENDERPGFMIGYVGPKVKNGQPIDTTESFLGRCVCDTAARALKEIGAPETLAAVEAWRREQNQAK